LRTGVQVITSASLARFERESEARALFRFDVRSPEEHETGHASGFVNAPGGQLVQATDDYIGIRGARIVLADDDGVRARMTASWLRQMGWRDVFVLADSLADRIDGHGAWRALPRALAPAVPEFSAQALSLLLQSGRAVVLDLASSPVHADGHIPGARFLLRSRLETDLVQLGEGDTPLVLTSPDGRLAHHVWQEATALALRRPVAVLRGGTAAWQHAGFPLQTGLVAPLSPPDDVYKRPYEGTDNADDFMRAYIDWELQLVEQIRRDGTARFAPI
jgi:rhodanese-related sulfurtransferase